MFAVGDKKETGAPIHLLEGERGTFRLVSPAGDISLIQCLPGRAIAGILPIGVTNPRAFYQVVKLSNNIGIRPLTLILK